MRRIVVRADEETDQALQHLVEMSEQSRSVAVREAITPAERELLLDLASRQADELRETPEDLAEMVEVAKHVDALRTW